MANMLYNGVELPDISAFLGDEPYHFITFTNGWPSDYYELYVGSGSVLAKKTSSTESVNLVGPFESYKLSNGAWVEDSSLADGAGRSLNVYNGDYQIIWSGFDILTSNGTIYFSATAPVDPNAPDVPELSITPIGAFLLGQQLRRNLAAVMEPVAYLYNGVRLPKLPEEYTTDYPYAYIANAYSKRYFLRRTKVELIKDGALKDPSEAKFETVSLFLTVGNGEVDADATWKHSTDIVAAGESPVWSNYDILNKDGTVYLAASEPVPVYE